MSKINTFDTDSYSTLSTNALYKAQKEDISKMRSSLLLANNAKDSQVATNALRNIAVLRIYHQIARVIQFLEYMDKLEDKMYKTMSTSMESLPNDIGSMAILLKTQNAMLQNMTLSQKLLEPYINMIDSATAYAQSIANVEDNNVDTKTLIPKQSRDKVRMTAQALLHDLDEMEAS